MEHIVQKVLLSSRFLELLFTTIWQCKSMLYVQNTPLSFLFVCGCLHFMDIIFCRMPLSYISWIDAYFLSMYTIQPQQRKRKWEVSYSNFQIWKMFLAIKKGATSSPFRLDSFIEPDNKLLFGSRKFYPHKVISLF